MRHRVRSSEYRARRLLRQATRHYWIDEPLPGGGSRVMEYRRTRVVSVDINPGESDVA